MTWAWLWGHQGTQSHSVSACTCLLQNLRTFARTMVACQALGRQLSQLQLHQPSTSSSWPFTSNFQLVTRYLNHQPSTTWTSTSPQVSPFEAREPGPSSGVSPVAKATRKTKTSRACATRFRSSSQESLGAQGLGMGWGPQFQRVMGVPQKRWMVMGKFQSKMDDDLWRFPES